jgi:hypothetical protein
MGKNWLRVTALSGTILAGSFAAAATAADLSPLTLQAVSAPNGKLELSGGWADINGQGSDADLRGGASVSMPLGDRFGLQVDGSAGNVFGDTWGGGNVHFFTRDPNSYLAGIVAGGGVSDHASLFYVGPEVELYLGNVSLEAWGGYLNLDPKGGSASDKYFVQADLAFYPTDNLRLVTGYSSVAKFNSGHVGMEYLLADNGLPLSLTAEGQIGDNGFAAVSAGLTFYFGGSSKSLINRHREDDPRNRSLSLFSGVGDGLNPPSGPKCDFDPETPLPPCPD